MKVFTFAVAIVAFVAVGVVSASNDEEGEMIHGDAASLVSEQWSHHNKVSITLLLMLFLNLHS